MFIPTKDKPNIRALVVPILEARYGIYDPDPLTSYERQQVYEHVKKRLRDTTTGSKDFEQKVKRLAEYLEI